MNFGLQVRESLANLVTSKLRSALTLLGVLVGTASVVALLTSGELATNHALEQFKTLGTDLLAVSIDTSEGGAAQSSAKLSLYDVETISDSSKSIISAAPYTTDFLQISYQGNKLQGNIIGATQILADVVKIGITEGRFLSFLDKDEHFCVIGNQIAKTLRESGVFVPLGKQLRVGDEYFTIIGVMGPWQENMFMYADVNTSIVIPLDAALSLNKYATIQNIIFKLAPNADIDEVQSAITESFNDALPGAKLFFRSAKQLIDSMKSQQRTFTLY
jgi:putative ABC transport system permease protein